jgi:hypothetical protein
MSSGRPPLVWEARRRGRSRAIPKLDANAVKVDRTKIMYIRRPM